MQIHEITKISLQEGIFDAFKTPEKIAAQAAEKLQAQGYGQPKPLPPVQDSVAAVQKNPAQQQYIKGLVAQWKQVAPEPTPAATATTATTATTAPPGGKVAPTPNVDVGGTMMMKGDDGLWYREDGRPTDPADAAKLDKLWYTGQRKVKGTVKEAYPTLQQRRAKQQATSGKPSTADSTSFYQTAFEKWAASKLRTVDPYTRQTITLDQLNRTDIKDELSQALAQVVATADNPQGNAVAVNNYLTIAVAGVARESQRLKSKNAEPSDKAPAGQAIVTQQEIRDKLAQAGLNPKQLEQLKRLAQDPAARQALLKSFGVQA